MKNPILDFLINSLNFNIKLPIKVIGIISSLVFSLSVNSQTYTFTPAGATGRFGPTQTQVNSSYLTTNLNGLVTATSGIQYWPAPATGVYRIEAYGAKGGNGQTTTGGAGAKMQGVFSFTLGQVLKIVVGQLGGNGLVGGGGGASFVTDNINTPFIIAGGGGGAAELNMYSTTSVNIVGNTSSSGYPGSNGIASVTASSGGTLGFGGSVCTTFTIGQGSGGGGLLGNGANGNPSTGGVAFISGADGGAGATSSVGVGGDGGFGAGGGGDWSNNTGAGGGGGYSGGGGGTYYGGGGGGGSYNSGSNQANTSGYNAGNGMIVFTKITGVNIVQNNFITCHGLSNAVLTASAFGGQAPYTYTWFPSGVLTQSAGALSAGTYTVRALDANSVVYTNTFVVTEPPILSLTVSGFSNVTCFGGLNGSATVISAGGFPAYSYSWSPSVSTSSLATGLAPGNYTCTVSDANACTSNTIITITQPGPLSIFGIATNPSVCLGGSSTLLGGGALTYTWTGGVLNAVPFTPAVTTNYTVTGSNAAGCTATAVTAVVVNALPSISISGSNSVCAGSPVILTASGASSYSWNTGATTSTISVSPLSTSNYSVIGTSSLACQNSATKSITVTNLPVVAANTNSAGICLGATTTLFGTGATTYAWSGGVTDNVPFSPTTTTNYTVTGTSVCGTSTAALNITVYSLPSLSITASNTLVCQGTSVTLSGSGALTYNWTGGVVNNVPFTASLTTAYNMIGIDANGCQNIAIKTISVIPAPVVIANVTNSVICLGNSTTLFGSGALSYTWTGGISDNIPFSPTATTTYTVFGTNSLGCQNFVITTVTVVNIPIVTANATSTSVCLGNTTTLFGGGATSYTWSGGIINNSSFTPALTTNYTVTGSNACGTTTNAITVIVNPLPIVTAGITNSVICFGNNTTLLGGGALSYTWSGGISNNVQFSPPTSASYTVTGTDVNGCQSTAVRSLTVNPLPLVTALVTNSVICFGNSTTLNGAGALTYTWSGGITNNIPFIPSISATYTVTGTDANNCQNTAIRSITVNALPTVTANASNSIICIGNTITFNGSGANTYTWSGGVLNGIPFSPNVTSTYTVNGTNTLTGCSSTNLAVKQITVNPLPVVNASVNNSLVCFGSSVTLNGSGTDIYSWTGGAVNGQAFAPGSSSNYSVSGTNTLTGCTSTNQAFVTVSVIALTSLSVNASSAAICSGGTVSLSGLNANTYTWTNGVINGLPFAPPTTSTYTLSGTNTLTGCSNTITQLVTVNPLPTITVNATNTFVCIGNPVILIASGANTYVWSNGITNAVSFTPTVSWTYSVSGTNTLTGCTNSAFQNIVVNARPVVIASVSNVVVCKGQSIIAIGAGASTYTWSGGITNGIVFTPSVTNTYSLVGTNALTSCTSTNSALQSVTVNPLPIVNAGVTNSIICFGDQSTLFGTGATTYTWSGGVLNSIPFSPSVTSTYSVSGTNTLTGCTSTNIAILSITVKPSPNISVSSSNTVLCIGETATLSASGANTYTWNTNQNDSLLIITPLVSTTYTISGSNSNSCVSSFVFNQQVSQCTGIVSYSTNKISTVFIYPNPNNGQFIISSETDIEINISNELGQIVKIISLNETNGYKASINELANGIYFVSAQKDNVMVRQKVIVSK